MVLGVVCVASVGAWDSGLCFPVMEVSLLACEIDGWGGVGRLLKMVCAVELG